MTKILPIKNSICRATHFRRGSGISRTYHNVKLANRIYNSTAGIEALLAFQAASHSWNINVAIFAGLMLYFANKAEKFRKLNVELQEYYQPIVDRAKQIYNSYMMISPWR